MREEDAAAVVKVKEVTAGMLIVGDEILNGFTQEVNLVLASRALKDVGISLEKAGR